MTYRDFLCSVQILSYQEPFFTFIQLVSDSLVLFLVERTDPLEDVTMNI